MSLQERDWQKQQCNEERKWNKRANNGHTRTGAWAATPLCPSDDDVVCPVQGFFIRFFMWLNLANRLNKEIQSR
jgi:hypothetical protein